MNNRKLKPIFVFFCLLQFLGGVMAPRAQAASSRPPMAVPILMYHHIRNYNNPADPTGRSLSVPIANFSEQLDDIDRLGFQTITFQDLSNGILPPNPIILTFDDGYDDFYLNALPELANRGMKAVVYIINSRVNSPGYLNERQIREISRVGIEIGAHSWSHVNLAGFSGARLWFEIKASKDGLEKMTGQKIVSFSYPFGRYSVEAVADVRRAGMEYAVLTHEGVANTAFNYTLYRLRVSPGQTIKNIFSNKIIE